MAVREALGRSAISLAYLPSTLPQRRFAAAIVALQFMAFAILGPFHFPAPRIDSFVPMSLAIVFIANLVTAVLLFNHSCVTASRALLVFANGYLFSAMIVIPHALTFPGAFAPKGLLGAGFQSSGWLNVFWHVGFLAAVIGYACLKGERKNNTIRPVALSAICWSVAIQLSLVCALTLAVTAGDRFMPRLFSDDLSNTPLVYYVAGAIVLMAVLVLLLVWSRRESMLDMWIMVMICMLISEMTLVTFGLTGRFYLGWYVSRTLAVAVSIVVLIALLSESMRLQAALLHANMMLEHERDNNLMNLQAVTAAIAHELKQPLTAISANSEAAQLFLNRPRPKLQEARPALGSIVADSHRASQILNDIRALFTGTDRESVPTDLNEIVLQTLSLLRQQLTTHGVTSQVQLDSDLPLVMGHKGQLQEVMINLLQNAIEAMNSIKDDKKSLQLRTERRDNAIVIEVKDSGPGIDPASLNRIFDAFFTTKLRGTGLGLAISRMIIERHGGRLFASSDGTSGALFQFVLPSNAALADNVRSA